MDLQFGSVISDTFNGGSVQSVKESVPGASIEAKQEVTGEILGLLVSLCILREQIFICNDGLF